MNEVIRNLTVQNLKNFINSFEETKNVFWDEQNNRLKHSGEFGTYREELVKKWLRVVVPEKFGISSGFLISDKGSISTQCDIIIYDKTTTPKIENIDNQRFFPIETVSCIGEVKSDINSIGELNNHLIKLAKTKKIRDEVSDPSPYYRGKFVRPFSPNNNSFDNIYSFLICNKFGFKPDVSNINYGNTEPRFKHNVVLSLQDGAFNYATNKGTANLCAPINNDEILNNYFLENDKVELPCHIMTFLIALQTALTLGALLNIDMAHYLTDNTLKEIK
jgi:hypothetical protein